MVFKETGIKAPCVERCPVHIDIPRYHRLIALGKLDAALAVILERNPLPNITGRVCAHPCEEACQSHHNHLGGPVAINALKRFVTERASRHGPLAAARPSGKRIAVVGSGPAGLTAAYYLTALGHNVTVLEALPVAGGMMRVGIPEYRLPRSIIDGEIEAILSIGFEIKTNSKVESVDDLLDHGYNAVFLAVGAHGAVKLGIDGDDSPGVVDGITFLKDVNLGKKVSVGERVAVIGGGNVAIDSARTALRLGSKEVTVIYRRTMAEMPASQEEVRAASCEGVKFIFLAAPARITRKSNRLFLDCVRMRLGRPDASGRRKPVTIKDSNFSLDFDSVIAAIGQKPDIPDRFNVEVTNQQTIGADSDTLHTSRPGVFAGGDAISGPATMVEAVAAGRRAAISIDRYLGGSGKIEATVPPYDEEQPCLVRGPSVGERTVMPVLPLKERLSGFGEVELGFDEGMAARESQRCLWCDMPIVANTKNCVGCLRCALMCSIRFKDGANPRYAKIRVAPPDRSPVLGESDIKFESDCDNCGICVRACTYECLSREAVGRAL